MITIKGTYAEDDVEMEYVGRVFWYGGRWCDGIGRVELVGDGDVLKACGDGSWFALYRPVDRKRVI